MLVKFFSAVVLVLMTTTIITSHTLLYQCSKEEPSLQSSFKLRTYNTEHETKMLFGNFEKIIDPVSGKEVVVDWKTDEFLRENGAVRGNPRNFCRIRGLAAAIINEFSTKKPVSCLKDFFQEYKHLAIWNTESTGPITELLLKYLEGSFTSSEYFGPQHYSGELVRVGIGSVRNEDMQQTSFSNSSLDLIISTEVFEHIPNPYDGFSETFRILKPGGKHIFTVPFSIQGYHDNKLAELSEGSIRFFGKPQYHGDLVRREGIPVFQIFGLEMVDKLCKLGFSVSLKVLYAPEMGIIGKETIYFVATKEDS
jgi:SAM-dependent methyltransferase